MEVSPPKVKPVKFLPDPKPTRARSRYPRWTMKNGTKVRIEDLSDTHLGHCVRMLERGAQAAYPMWAAMLCGADGWEGDTDPCGDEFLIEGAIEADNWESCLPDIYYHLVDEASRRGLEIKREDNHD